MTMPAKAASGTTTAPSSQGLGLGAHTSTPPIDPLLKLASERAALESSSGFWGGFLVVASIVVAIGVVLEFAEDIFEIEEAIRTKQPISWRKQVVLLGTLLVIAGVIAEFWAEGGSGGVETKLRANNAAVQGVLDARARNTTQAAVDLATKYGGLQSFVDAQEHQIDGKMGELRHFADTEKDKTDAVIAALNKDKADLDSARADSVAAAKTAETQLKIMQTENTPRTLLTPQIANLTVRMSSFSGVKSGIFLMHAPTSDAAPLANLFVTLLTSAGWKTGGGRYDLMGGPTFDGVIVAVHEGAAARAQNAAATLVAALNEDGIAALLQSEHVKGDAVSVLGAYSGPPDGTPDIWIVVGNKPPSGTPYQ